MKPDLALSLSFDGIRLLHRGPAGWVPAGEVPLDAPDLGGQLRALREAAHTLDPEGLGVKVLLPADHVRLVAIDDPAADEAARRTAVEGVASGAGEDLILDHARGGGRTHVAAIARATLDEAEAFVVAHGFKPLCFAAPVAESAFGLEAFFGETRLARGLLGDESVEPEARPAANDDIAEPTKEAPAEAAVLASATETEDSAPSVPEEPGNPAQAEAAPTDSKPSDPGPALPDSDPQHVFAAQAAPMRVETAGASEARTDAHEGGEARAGWPLAIPAASGAASRPPKASPVKPAAQGLASRTPSRKRALPAVSSEKAPATGAGRARVLATVLPAALLLGAAALGTWAAVGGNPLAGMARQSEPQAVGPASPSAFAATTGTAAPDAPAEGSPETVADAPPVASPEAAEGAAAVVAAAIADLPDPLAADAAVAPGVAVSPAEAERVHAATGVWLRAPRLPLQPEADALGDAVGPAPSTATPGAPPALAALTVDPTLPVQPAPPPAGATFARDARGLILATPEGTVTPQGILVVAGSPEVLPPTRPGTVAPIEPEPAEPEVAGSAAPVALPGVRPPTRTASPLSPDQALAALGVQDGEAEGEAVPPGTLAFAAEEAAPGATAGGVTLAGLRPSTRPPGAAATESEPAPEILSAFDGPRPGPRPEGLAPEAVAEAPAEEPTPDPATDEAVAAALAATPAVPDLQSTLASIVDGAPDPLAGATAQAVAAARRPDARPRNFDGVVSDQLARAARAAQPRAASAGGIAPTALAAAAPSQGGLEPEEQAESEPEIASAAAAQPSGPISGGVAQAATFADVMALREINLIGVFGQPNARRALVRLGNGRFLRVAVGDNLDGGQVTAIADNALNYTKRGRTHQLVIPGPG